MAHFQIQNVANKMLLSHSKPLNVAIQKVAFTFKTTESTKYLGLLAALALGLLLLALRRRRLAFDSQKNVFFSVVK